VWVAYRTLRPFVAINITFYTSKATWQILTFNLKARTVAPLQIGAFN
jgi:hypothetical protein